MLSLNLPSYEIKIAERNGKNVIFDMLRKRYVALTPEEWVRQHFVHYLTDYKGYPKGLLANEIQLDLNGTKKRCDTVLYNKDLSAKLIVEYKAPHIEITQTVFDQITRYGKALKDEVIARIAAKHNATPAQVILAWAMGEGYSVIPSSTKRENLESNLKAQNLQLDAEDKKAIAALDCNDRLVSPEGLAPEWD